MNKNSCIALFSGGLDSLLAVKVMQNLGVNVIPVNFNTGFFFNAYKFENGNLVYKDKLPDDIKVKVIDITYDFFKMIKAPKHGFGKNLNPCIDCKILMLKKAKELMGVFNAGYVITGEVIGQRPMTQNINSMEIIERESGLQGFLLRPLCAKHLPETEPEKMGWVDRNKLLDFKGRSRKPQLQLAKEFGLTEFIKPPAGGCILTDINYSKKLKDFLNNENELTKDDVFLLSIGRHFRKDKIKFIIGRNLQDNQNLLEFKDNAIIFECKDVPSPIGFTKSKLTFDDKIFIASAVARYSDAKTLEKVKVVVYNKSNEEEIEVKPASEEILKKYRI
jgi:tRNA U34 2-thiouridine synthase MnmA/TrmU